MVPPATARWHTFPLASPFPFFFSHFAKRFRDEFLFCFELSFVYCCWLVTQLLRSQHVTIKQKKKVRVLMFAKPWKSAQYFSQFFSFYSCAIKWKKLLHSSFSTRQTDPPIKKQRAQKEIGQKLREKKQREKTNAFALQVRGVWAALVRDAIWRRFAEPQRRDLFRVETSRINR